MRHFLGLLLLTSTFFFAPAHSAEVAKPHTVIFAHGSPGNKNAFDGYLANQELGAIAHLVAENRPGFGEKFVSGQQGTFAEQVRFLAEQVRSAKGRVTLVGYSQGTVVAMRVAELLGSRVENLVLVAGVYNPNTIITQWFLKPGLWPIVSSLNPWEITQGHHDSKTLSADIAEVLSGLSQIRARVTAIHGATDHLVPPQDLQFIQALKPQVYVREGAGHGVLSTDAAFIQRHLIRILTETPADLEKTAVDAPKWDISEKRLKQTVNTLTVPELKGRRGGSKEGQKVAEFLANSLREMQIAPLGESGRYDQAILSGYKGKQLGSNILGVVGPKTARRCVLFGAHYDGQGVIKDEVMPSADDNASGVAGLLEIARNLKASETQLKKCVVIAFWDLEEAGMQGSRYWVANPTLELARLDLSVTFDLIGGNVVRSGAERLLFVFGAQAVPFLDADPLMGMRAVQFNYDLIEPAGAMTSRSDYVQFRAQGVPSIFLTTGTPWYYHSKDDTVDKLSFPKLRQVVQYSLGMVWRALAAEGMVSGASTIPSDESQTRELGEVLRAALTDPKNFIDPSQRAKIDLWLNRIDVQVVKPLPLCQRRQIFYDFMEAIGSMKSGHASVARLVSSCRVRD